MTTLFSNSQNFERIRNDFGSGLDVDAFADVLYRHCPTLWSSPINQRGVDDVGARDPWATHIASAHHIASASSKVEGTMGDADITTTEREGRPTAAHPAHAPRISEALRQAIEMLFFNIDCNGDGSVTWEETYNFAIDTAALDLVQRPYETIRPYSKISATKREDHFTYMKYIPQLDLIAVSSRNCPLQLIRSRDDFEVAFVARPFETDVSSFTEIQACTYVSALDTLVACSADLRLRWWHLMEHRLTAMRPLPLEHFLTQLQTVPTAPTRVLGSSSRGTLAMFELHRGGAEPRKIHEYAVETGAPAVSSAAPAILPDSSVLSPSDIPRSPVQLPLAGFTSASAPHTLTMSMSAPSATPPRRVGTLCDFCFVTPASTHVMSSSYDLALYNTDIGDAGAGHSSVVAHTPSALVKMAYMESSQLVATVAMDNRIATWVTYASHSPATYFHDGVNPHRAKVVGLCAPPNSHQIMTADVAGKVKIWDVRTYRCAQTIFVGPPVDVTPDNHDADAGSGSNLSLGAATKRSRTRGGGGAVGGGSGSGSSSAAVAMILASARSGAQAPGGHAEKYRIGAACFISTSGTLVCSSGNSILAYDDAKGANPMIAAEDPVVQLVHDPVHNTVVAITARDVRVWDLEFGVLLSCHRDIGPRDMTALGIDGKCRRLFIGFHDGSVVILSCAGMTRLNRVSMHNREITALAYAETQACIVASTVDGYCCVFAEKETVAPMTRLRLSTNSASSVAVSPAISVFAVGCASGVTWIGDLAHPKVTLGEYDGAKAHHNRAGPLTITTTTTTAASGAAASSPATDLVDGVASVNGGPAAVRMVAALGQFPVMMIGYGSGLIRAITVRPALDVVSIATGHVGNDVRDFALRAAAARPRDGPEDSPSPQHKGDRQSHLRSGSRSPGLPSSGVYSQAVAAEAVIAPCCAAFDSESHDLWIGDSSGHLSCWSLCALFQRHHLATAAYPQTKIFPVATSRPMPLVPRLILRAHGEEISCVEVVVGGNGGLAPATVITGGDDHRILFWSCADGSLLAELCSGRSPPHALTSALVATDSSTDIGNRKITAAAIRLANSRHVIPPFRWGEADAAVNHEPPTTNPRGGASAYGRFRLEAVGLTCRHELSMDTSAHATMDASPLLPPDANSKGTSRTTKRHSLITRRSFSAAVPPLESNASFGDLNRFLPSPITPTVTNHVAAAPEKPSTSAPRMSICLSDTPPKQTSSSSSGDLVALEQLRPLALLQPSAYHRHHPHVQTPRSARETEGHLTTLWDASEEAAVANRGMAADRDSISAGRPPAASALAPSGTLPAQGGDDGADWQRTFETVDWVSDSDTVMVPFETRSHDAADPRQVKRRMAEQDRERAALERQRILEALLDDAPSVDPGAAAVTGAGQPLITTDMLASLGHQQLAVLRQQSFVERIPSSPSVRRPPGGPPPLWRTASAASGAASARRGGGGGLLHHPSARLVGSAPATPHRPSSNGNSNAVGDELEGVMASTDVEARSPQSAPRPRSGIKAIGPPAVALAALSLSDLPTPLSPRIAAPQTARLLSARSVASEDGGKTARGRLVVGRPASGSTTRDSALPFVPPEALVDGRQIRVDLYQREMKRCLIGSARLSSLQRVRGNSAGAPASGNLAVVMSASSKGLDRDGAVVDGMAPPMLSTRKATLPAPRIQLMSLAARGCCEADDPSEDHPRAMVPAHPLPK